VVMLPCIYYNVILCISEIDLRSRDLKEQKLLLSKEVFAPFVPHNCTWPSYGNEDMG